MLVDVFEEVFVWVVGLSIPVGIVAAIVYIISRANRHG